MRVVEPFICNFDDRIIKVHWRINGQAAECQMGRVALQCLAGYYHINDGHLLDTKNK